MIENIMNDKAIADLNAYFLLALAEARHSRIKYKILAEACMVVSGVVDGYLDKRPKVCAQHTEELKKELLRTTTQVKKGKK